MNLGHDVELEVIQCKRVGAGCLRREGAAAAEGGAHWRAPVGDAFPRPRDGEVVSFLAFHERGLGYPAHWFLRGLLNEWGLKLQHLNLAGALHIAGPFFTNADPFYYVVFDYSYSHFGDYRKERIPYLTLGK